ncbi:MAG: hypothetical protein V4614_18365 [Pseudomonadota bacterium]
MARSASTAPIKSLFLQALDSLPRPLTDDVTDEVFHVIETNPSWLKNYTDLCADRGKTTVNTWGGYWIANAVERSGLGQVPATRSTLIQSYSKLDRPAAPKRLGKKASEDLARNEVFEYFRENKSSLPAHVTTVREEIVELVMSGMSPVDAFNAALDMQTTDQVRP